MLFIPMTTFSSRLFSRLYDLLDPLPKELIAIIHSYCEIGPVPCISFSRRLPIMTTFTKLLIVNEKPFRAVFYDNVRRCSNYEPYIFVNEKQTRVLGCECDYNEDITRLSVVRANDHGIYTREEDGLHYYDIDPIKDREQDCPSGRDPFILTQDGLIVGEYMVCLHENLRCPPEWFDFKCSDTYRKYHIHQQRTKKCVGVADEVVVSPPIYYCFKNGTQLRYDSSLIDDDDNFHTPFQIYDPATKEVLQYDINLYETGILHNVKFIEDGNNFHLISTTLNTMLSFQIVNCLLVPFNMPRTTRTIHSIYQQRLITSDGTKLYINNNWYDLKAPICDVQNGSDGIWVLTEKKIIHLPNGCF